MKINKAKLFRRSVLLVLILGSVGIYFANRFAKSKGFDGIGDFVTNYYHNKDLADQITPKELKIEIADSDYEFLKKRRQEGLDRGIQINDGNNYVPCLVIYDGDTITGEMRLKGHMTDHLEGEKWSYRVKTEEPVMGMYRFSLQHPANRNYSYEWIYHQLLKEEDVIALQYDFLNFSLNENNLGIYAVEEHFGQHVLTSNNRPPGAILRWNPQLYWEWRIDELQGLYLDEEYSAFSSSFVEPYDRGVVFKDSILTANYYEGAKLLEEFRRGMKVTSEVFDVERMASFHAIIDLVGGHHSLDWSDVKFFYNSKSKRIEPVGYESFSIRKTERLAGQQAKKSYDGDEMDYHALLFSDPKFFAAYIQALERICDEDFFNSFIDKIQSELDKKIGVIAHEFPYIKFSYNGYFENIDLIQHNLELPKAFHAFTEELTDSTITLSISPVSDYPIEITQLVSNGKRSYDIEPSFIIPSKPRETYARYFNLTIPHDGKKMKDLTLKARIVGSSNEFEVEVVKYSSVQKLESFEIDSAASADAYFTYVSDSVVVCKSDITHIRQVLALDRGVSLKVLPGQKFIFEHGGELLIENANLYLFGEDENEINVMCLNASRGFVVKNGKVRGSYLNVQNSQEPIIYSHNSSISINSSTFADCQDGIFFCEKSTIDLKNCYSGSIERLGLFFQSELVVENMTANNGAEFIFARGSEIRIRDSKITGYDKVVEIFAATNCRFWNTEFKSNELISNMNDASNTKLYNCKITSGDAGFRMDQESVFTGESLYQLTKSDASALSNIEISATE